MDGFGGVGSLSLHVLFHFGGTASSRKVPNWASMADRFCPPKSTGWRGHPPVERHSKPAIREELCSSFNSSGAQRPRPRLNLGMREGCCSWPTCQRSSCHLPTNSPANSRLHFWLPGLLMTFRSDLPLSPASSIGPGLDTGTQKCIRDSRLKK